MLDKYRALGVDIDREKTKAEAWLLTPRAKGRKMTQQFFANWLARAAQNDAVVVSQASGETPDAYRVRISDELRDTLRAQLLTWQTAGRWDEGFNAASSRTAAIKIHGQTAGPAFDRVFAELNKQAQKAEGK